MFYKHWNDVFSQDSVPQGLAVLSLAVTIGLALGAIRVRGLRLGISGVLFAALFFGQIKLAIEPRILGFLRDFALIIFVYALGLQVGPGFLASLRQEGLRLNILSLTVVILGAAMTGGVVLLMHLPRYSASGLYAGAFTTTPGLAAGQEALVHLTGAGKDAAVRAGLIYAITYPFGVIGPILVIAALKRIFRVRLDAEVTELTAQERIRRPPIEVADIEVTDGEHVGRRLRDMRGLRDHGIIFSRMLRNGRQSVPNGETEIQIGDIFHAVGPRIGLDQIMTLIGRAAPAINASPSDGPRREEIVVTRTQVLRRPLHELDLARRSGVTIVRLHRAGVDLVPRANTRLLFGDQVTVVGPDEGLRMVEKELGNCPDTLNRPQLVPIFLGIVLGVAVGSIPIAIPGLHTTLRIGLAGGPMIAAIILSQLGNIGSVVWYMPAAANSLFRDFGLAVFLACVGLQAGNHFVQNLLGAGGITLVCCGAAITILPVLLIGIFARVWMKMNFVTLSGWVAGAMTSMPTLMFANDLARNDAPAPIYAAVAPLALLTPIICAQVLALLGI